MFQHLDEAVAFIRHKSVAMVDLKFCDLWGRWRHVTLPAGRFNPRLLETGVGFDGSSLGRSADKSGDLVLVPELATAFLQTHMTEWMEMPRRDPFLLSNSTQAGKQAKKPSPVTQLKLNGIWRQTGGRIAAINNRVYSECGLVEGYRIERIDGDQVWFAARDRNERLRFENYDVKALVPKGTNRLSTASGGNARIAGPRL